MAGSQNANKVQTTFRWVGPQDCLQMSMQAEHGPATLHKLAPACLVSLTSSPSSLNTSPTPLHTVHSCQTLTVVPERSLFSLRTGLDRVYGMLEWDVVPALRTHT